MSEQSNKKGLMVKDTIIYMLAKGIEGVVGIVTMSVMTYLFVAEQMGYYATVNIAVTTLGMVAIQWLVQSSLRYINKYDIEGRFSNFYATVFSSWLKTNAIVVLLCVLILIVFKLSAGKYTALGKISEVYSTELIILGILWFVSYNSKELIVAMLAATRRAKLNLLISLILVTGKLALMWLLCVKFKSRIEWIFLSYFVLDLIASIIGFCSLRIYKYLNFKNASPEILAELKSYGMPLMGNMITTSVLNKSDIYIITAYIGATAAGIYQTNYSLVATAFTLLSASIMRGSYPTIVRTWSEGKNELAEKLVSEAVRFYLLIAVPAVLGVFAISDVIATTLFESEYFEGNTIMLWVALGMMFLGLTEYSIKPWELNGSTMAIFKRSLIGGIVNIGLNLVLLKIFKNYHIAAVTTFIGFGVYFVLAKLGTRKYMKWHLNFVVYLRIILSGVVMAAVLIILKNYIPHTKINLIIFVILGMIIYTLVLYLSGEIKNELRLIVNKLRNK